MASPVRILHLEDDRNDAELVQATLEADGLACEVTRVETRAEFSAAVKQGGLDLILADYSLPAFDGLSALAITREKRPEAPFLFVSGTLGEEVAIETLKSGATDYVLKGRLARLAPAVRRALREAEDRAERQRAETALRTSEKRFRALIENSSDAIALVSAEGTILYETPSASRILGYAADERAGRSAFELIHPDDLEYTRQLFAQMLKEPGANIPGQLSFRHKDGSWRWMELVGTNLLAEMSVGAVVVNFRDVTERVLAEEAIRQSEEQYRTLVEQASDGIFVTNPEGQYVEVNTSGCAMLDYSHAELLRMRMTDLVSAEDLALAPLALDELQAGKTVVRERRLRRKDGTLLPVEISAKRLPDGRLQGIVRDITARKAAEAALQASERQLSLIYENVSDVLFYLAVEPDDRFRFVSVNSAFLKATGLTEDQIVGKLVQEVIPEPAHALVLGNYKEALRTKKTAGWEEVSDYPAGKKYGAVSVTPIFDATGNCTHLIGTVHDITERKQAAEALAAKNEEIKAMSQQLWQTAKLATMGELAANIAHELNNPLATVSLRVESLLAQMPADDSKRRALAIIEQETERMGALVANLLQFSRRSAPQISTLDVGEEIGNTLELIQYQLRHRSITVAREFAPDVPLVRADRQQLRQLFLNLFTNASDAMPQGGTLTIRVSAAEKQVVIEIADTGVGIPPEDLPKVVEPFFTTKPEGKGTGLGLPICRRIVQEHNGMLDITSDGVPGRGTTVRIALPLTNGANQAFLKAS